MATETQIHPRIPELKTFPPVPVWWHNHGIKMKLTEATDTLVEIKNGGVATLKIDATPTKEELSKYFRVEWFIRSSWNEDVLGRRLMTPQILSAAFGLTDMAKEYGGQFLLDRFGGDSADQGNFIRWGRYLNIPGPGTGHDHDPNISVMVEPEMRAAVNRILIVKELS